MKTLYLICLIFFLLFGCSAEKKEDLIYPLPANAAQLLVGKASKTWKLSLDSKGQTYLAITSERIPELFKVKEGSKTKYFKITALSDSVLVHRFPHQLFNNETTIIEDTLIPEDAPEGDRNFHW